MKVKIKLNGGIMPKKATAGAAAYDLYVPKDIVVKPGRSILPLCFAMEMENGYEALIDARSGFSSKGMVGFEVSRAFSSTPYGEVDTMRTEAERFDCDVIQGKIDSDYRGEVGVIVHNRSCMSFMLKEGTRIAQMTFHKVEDVEWDETETLSDTGREGGFGSTGVK